MTREEQILNKAIDYSEIEENFVEYDDCGDVCNDKDFVEKAFIEGAKWADENPQGMSKMRKDYEFLFMLKKRELIENACEWLDINFPNIDNVGSWYKDSFIKQFKKAMEE